MSIAREKYGFTLYHASSLKIKGVDSLPMANLVTYTGSSAVNLDYMETHETAGVCLDSGAYPAFKQNKDLDLERYIQFVLQHQKNLDWFAELDFIPRTQGGRTEDLQRYASEKTWERYVRMHETQGMDVEKLAFVLHGQSSIEDDLRKALEWRSPVTGRGVEMIACGLSFPNDFLRKHQLNILDRCFKEYGFTGRFHALGLQDKEMYKKYDFITSADSSSVVRLTISGAIKIGGVEYKVLDDDKVFHKSKRSPLMREHEKAFLKERCEKFGRDWDKASRQDGYVERYIWGCLEANDYLCPKGV